MPGTIGSCTGLVGQNVVPCLAVEVTALPADVRLWIYWLSFRFKQAAESTVLKQTLTTRSVPIFV